MHSPYYIENEKIVHMPIDSKQIINNSHAQNL